MEKSKRWEKLAGDTRLHQYKWEFLRRNEKYKRDFAVFAAEFPEWIYCGRLLTPGTSMQRDQPEVFSFFREHVDPAAEEISKKWLIQDPTDPAMSFEDVSAWFVTESEIRTRTRKDHGASQVSMKWDYFSRVLGEVPLTRTGLRFIQVQIDIAQPLEKIFAETQGTIELARARYRHHFGPISEPRKRSRARLKEYDSYLKVWDLRQQPLTFEEIAFQLFPREMDSPNARGAMTKRVRSHFKRAEILIAGEYRRIEG